MDGVLAELFSSKVRAAVLGHLLPRPHLGFSLTDLHRRLGLPVSSLQHECYKLERIGVLAARRDGNARRYHVEPSCPVRVALTALVVAGIGPEAALRAAVEAVPGLEIAFLAGPLPGDDGTAGTGAGSAAGAAPPAPRLVLVGELPLDELAAVTTRAEAALALPPGGVEPAFFRPADWRARIAERHPYVVALLAAPRLPLLDHDTPVLAAPSTVLPGSRP